MDPLVLAILKTAVSFGLKLYLTSLFESRGVTHDRAALGYAVPRWYLARDQSSSAYYAFGTSVLGDEFDALNDARRQAVSQMAEHVRAGSRRMIAEHVRYDETSLKQRRLVELFARAEGLEAFLAGAAKTDRKEIVKVPGPPPALRAFVRISVPVSEFQEYQQRELHALKERLTRQKTEDIVAEMDAEAAALDRRRPGDGTAPPAGAATNAEATAPAPPASGAGAAFDELDAETKPQHP